MDTSAMIKMDIELDQVQLKGTQDFFNNVVGVLDKYEVEKSYGKLCMLMARKIQEASYLRLILEELKSNSPDLIGCIMMYQRFKDSPEVGTKDTCMIRK